MAELADAMGLGPIGMTVQVRVLLAAYLTCRLHLRNDPLFYLTFSYFIFV